MSGRGASLNSLSNSNNALNTLRTRSSRVPEPSRRDRFKAFLGRVGNKYDDYDLEVLAATTTTSIIAASTLALASGGGPDTALAAGTIGANVSLWGNMLMQRREGVRQVLSKANEKFEKFIKKISPNAVLSMNIGTITMSATTVAGMSPVKSISLAAFNGTGFFVGDKLSSMNSQRKVKKARRAAEQARAEKKAEDEMLSDFYKN